MSFDLLLADKFLYCTMFGGPLPELPHSGLDVLLGKRRHL
jgi:hypothetical protein